MSLPCRATLMAVRRSQLQLVRQHIERLEAMLEGLPTVASQMDDTTAKTDEELADDYIEIRERLDLVVASAKRSHFRLCGRFAWELRQYAAEEGS